MKQASENTANNVGIYLLNQGASIVVPLLLLRIITEHVGPGEYGALDMLRVISVVGVGLGNWGLLFAFERFFFAYADTPEKQNQLLGTLLRFTVSLFIIVVGVATFFRYELSFFLTASTSWGALLVMVLTVGCLTHLNGFFLSFMKNTGAASHYLRYSLVRLLVSAGTVLVLVVVYELGILGVVFGGLVGETALLLLFLTRFRREVILFDRAIFLECFRFGWPLASKVLVGVLNITVDKFMVGTLVSLAALGAYGRAQGIAVMVFAVMTAVQNAYAPRWNRILFSLDAEPTQSLSALFTEYVCIILLPASLLVLFCQEVIFWLTASAYHEITPLVVILALYYVLLAFGKLYGTVGGYLKITKTMATVSVITSLANVGLNLLLIPQYGAVGAVFATLVTGLLSTVVIGVCIAKRFTIGFEKRNLLTLYGGILICCAGSLYCSVVAMPYYAGLGLRLLCGLIALSAWLSVIGLAKARVLLARVPGLRSLKPQPSVPPNNEDTP